MDYIKLITLGTVAARLPHFPRSAVMRHRISLAIRILTVWEGARAGAAANRRGLVPRTLPIQ